MFVLALRPDADAHAVGGLAEGLGLEVIQITMEDEDAPQRDVLLANNARTARARYVQDFYLDLAYLVLDGPEAEPLADGFAPLALDPAALLGQARAGLDPKDREAMKTLVRLALTAAPERRAAVLDLFARIAEAEEAAPAFTLVAALSALNVWPGALAEARPVLVLLVTHASEMVRDEARVFADAFAGYLRQN